MSKQRVGLLTQMRSKLTLEEEDELGNSKKEEGVDKVEGEGDKTASKERQLPEGGPPETLETLLLSDAW